MVKRSNKGFTLIEVMIVVVIISILTAIALPSYTQYIIRSKVTEAVQPLSTYAVTMNQYMQDTGSYANAGACGKSAPATTKYAAYTCTATDTTYTVTMTGQDQIAAYAFTINELGTRATTASPHGTSASCWMIGSSC